MKSVVSPTVPQNVNVPNPKHLVRKSQKHPESLKHLAMALATSLATNLIAIAATQIALMNAPKYPMLMTSLLQPVMMTFQHQKHHFLNANTPIGAHGLHAVQPV